MVSNHSPDLPKIPDNLVRPLDLDEVGVIQETEYTGEIHPIFTQHKFVTDISVDTANPTAIEVKKEIDNCGGKIPFAKFMDISLYGPDGYYSAGKVEIGTGKDFVTSPETSEIFGAGLGKTLMKVWEAMGKPNNFRVIEMGAGNGNLVYSVLKWSQELYPEFYQALRYTILEYSDDLILRQRDKLSALGKIEWVKGSAYELPFDQAEGIFLSNELPDAFPVERVIRINGQLKQKYVTIENDKWVELWDEPSKEVIQHIDKYGITVKEGVEEPINIHAARLQKHLVASLKQGAIITIDYGKNGEVGKRNESSVRYSRKINEKERVAGEGIENIFAAYQYPGNVDMTASVNFRILEDIARQQGLPIVFSGFQKDLFLNIGITEVVKRMEATFRKLKSWRDVLDLSDNLSGYVKFMYDIGHYYSHILFKGIDSSKMGWESSDKDYWPILPKVPVSLGISKKKIIVDLRDIDKWRTHMPSPAWETDDQGILWLFPDQIIGAKILTPDGNMILDLTKENSVKRVVEGLGYQL